jgi:HEAT repeat protein
MSFASSQPQHQSSTDNSSSFPVVPFPQDDSIRIDALVRLLYQEDDASQALIELAALRECNRDQTLQATVLASLLMHDTPEVRLEAARGFLEIPKEAIDASYVLDAAIAREEQLNTPHANDFTREELRSIARTYSSSDYSRLRDVQNRASHSSQYAREQNMTSFSGSEQLPQSNFDWIMTSLSDDDRTIRNSAAYALSNAVPSLDESKKGAALLRIAFGLKDPAMEEGFALYKARLLDTAVRIPNSAQTIMPLIGALFHSSNPLVRTNAAITTLLLSQEKEDEMTDIIIASLRDRNSLKESPTPVKPIPDATEARIQVEAQYWAHVGMSMYLEKHFNIRLDTWAIDKTKEEFIRTLDDICKRFENSMNALGERTANELSALYRGSLVRHGGLIMYRLGEQNQTKILEELCTISYRSAEHEAVRQNALESIASATIDTSFTVGPLLQIGLTDPSAKVRKSAFKALGELRQLTEKSWQFAVAASKEFTRDETDQEVQEAALTAHQKLIDRRDSDRFDRLLVKKNT